jgi:hypothetical protein
VEYLAVQLIALGLGLFGSMGLGAGPSPDQNRRLLPAAQSTFPGLIRIQSTQSISEERFNALISEKMGHVRQGESLRDEPSYLTPDRVDGRLAP